MMLWHVMKVRCGKWAMVLSKLAKDITDKLRKSVTVDWQYKDSVRAVEP